MTRKAKVLGIIAEYNPFHNGHLYHLRRSMELSAADYCVAVMSGNFTQRGEPAMWDKRRRARAAVENGVDLVLELPFAYACNTAAEFARGGVSLLSGLGCVTDLAFGCESELPALQRAAELLCCEPKQFSAELSALQKSGLSYPAAVSAALRKCGEEEAAALLSAPNNILAVEYIKQCNTLAAPMRLHGIIRADSGYHCRTLPITSAAPITSIAPDTAVPMASAGAIREAWDQGEEGRKQAARFLPEATRAVLCESEMNSKIEARALPRTVSIEDFYPLIAAAILTSTPEQLRQIYGVTGGMENAMKKALRTSTSVESLIAGIKTKHYTRTGISRALIQTMARFTRTDYDEIAEKNFNYAHVLAFNEKGRSLLAHIKRQETADIPIFSNLSREAAPEAPYQQLLKYDLLTSDFYHLARGLSQGNTLYDASDLVLRPFHKKG